MELKKKIKKAIIGMLPERLKNEIRRDYHKGNFFYSQEGEDLVLARIFDQQRKGVYVDIGAHHPSRFSNTMYFYLKGWRGINIDPLPGTKSLFDKVRPEDITIEKGISINKQSLAYFQFAEPAFNTFSKALVQKIALKSTLVETTYVQCLTLSEVLRESKVNEIDFLSIDVEGWELDVLKSNDWTRFIPRVIVLEDLKFDLEDYNESDTYKYLHGRGYFLFSKLFHSVIFIHENSKKLVNR